MLVVLVQGLFAANVSARFDGDKGSASKLSHLVVSRRPEFLATGTSPYGCLTWKLASLRGSDLGGGGVSQDGSCSVSWNSRLGGPVILPWGCFGHMAGLELDSWLARTQKGGHHRNCPHDICSIFSCFPLMLEAPPPISSHPPVPHVQEWCVRLTLGRSWWQLTFGPL